MRIVRPAAATFAFLLAATGFHCGGDDEQANQELTEKPFIPSGNPDGKDTGGECAVGNDCKSGVCESTKCSAPTNHDNIRNGDETGVDCGGSAAPKCTGGSPCKVAEDCASGQCTDGTCAGPKEDPPKPDDGKKNADETDVDCGGSVAPKCADNKGCKTADDCTSGVCTNDVCQVPSPTDNVKNGDETDVDCGGTKAPQCAVGKKCIKDDDCTTGCNYKKECADSPSCTRHFGGDTCGSGEVGAANATHESCCKALPIPGQATKLDKYQITAGRMRAMIERLNGNVLGWYEANKAKLSQTNRNQIEAYKSFLPSDKASSPYGAEYQVGGTIYLPKRPSISQGCAAKVGDYGSHTYANNLEGDVRGLTQDDLDSRALNCVPYPLLAAFCAWDGGRLQTMAEHDAAWGGNLWPWGNSPTPGGYRLINGAWTLVNGYYEPTQPNGGAQFNQPCPTCNDSYANWQNNYQYYMTGNGAANPTDYAYWINAPGRFPNGNGAGGHADLAGNLMEITADTGTVDDTDGGGNQIRIKWTKNGSWEGHAMRFPDFAFSFMTKYGKAGGRCAR